MTSSVVVSGYRQMRFMALALLLVALYGIRTDLQAAPPQLDTPVKFDDFLSSVRAETAADARIVVVGDLPAQEGQRAAFVLYPRVVYTPPGLGYAHAPGVRSPRWQTLLRFARQQHAGYIALWDVPIKPPRPVMLRKLSGTLVEVNS
jgi:hypothetical protein